MNGNSGAYYAGQNFPATEKPKKKGKKAVKIVLVTLGSLMACFIAVAVLIAGIIASPFIFRELKYNKANGLLEDGNYEEAIVLFTELDGYKLSYSKIEDCKMNMAKGLMEDGEYDAAIEIFEELIENGSVYNTEELIKECRYNIALGYMEDGKLSEAKRIFKELNGFSQSEEKVGRIRLSEFYDDIKNVSVGDIIYFGGYEQDNDTENGKEDIAWKVLDKKNGRIFVTSSYVLDCKCYDGLYGETWADSSIRSFLNETFFDRAFSLVEQKLIPTVSVVTENNPKDNTWGGNTVSDKIFLLSIAEVEKYFPNSESRKCSATNYAVSFDNHTNMTQYGKSPCIWWLRNAVGGNSYSGGEYASTVNVNGFVDSDPTRYSSLYGYNYNVCYSSNQTMGVRPAMWIDISGSGADMSEAEEEEMYSPGNYKVKVPENSVLNLRKNASVTADVLCGIPTETVIEITKIVYDENGDAETSFWGKTEYLGYEGYVLMLYLDETEEEPTEEEETAETEEISTEEVSSEAPTEPNSDNDEYNTGSYICDAEPFLSLRESPSVDAVTIAKIPGGYVVQITEIIVDEEASDNYTKYWGKTTYDGVTGYIPMGYLTES